MAETPLSEPAAAVAAIQPEQAPETCERIALAVLMAATTVSFDEEGEPHVCWKEAACLPLADKDPRLAPGRRHDA